MKKKQLLSFLIIFLGLSVYLLGAQAQECPFCGGLTNHAEGASATNVIYCSCQMEEEAETTIDDQADFAQQTDCAQAEDSDQADNLDILSQQIDNLHLAENEPLLTERNPEFNYTSDTWVTTKADDAAGINPVSVSLNTITQTVLASTDITHPVADNPLTEIEDITSQDNNPTSTLLVISNTPAVTESGSYSQMLINGSRLSVMQPKTVQLRGMDINPNLPSSQQKKKQQGAQIKKIIPRCTAFACGEMIYPIQLAYSNIHDGKKAFLYKHTVMNKNGKNLVKLKLRYDNEPSDIQENIATGTYIPPAANSCVADTSASILLEKGHIYKDNFTKTGFVAFSRDPRIKGNMLYTLPSAKIQTASLGKGGNAIVFEVYCFKKLYAVKRTVHRPNEIKIQADKQHPNILDLHWVLMGPRYPQHTSKYYCFHFMDKMDKDLRTEMGFKLDAHCIGSLYHLKMHPIMQQDHTAQWLGVTEQFKYILRSVLSAMAYLHSEGIVHRDIKASNILLKANHQCDSFFLCNHSTLYTVKLCDFDSSGTIPGWGLQVNSDHLIKFASILPLGTPGYRAPEVSCHIVLSGPYEVLYDAKVDIWSLGCLMLNLAIGHSGPIKQRGWACLLLSTRQIDSISTAYRAFGAIEDELFQKGVKTKKLHQRLGESDPGFVEMVRKCLQVEATRRPSAQELLKEEWLQPCPNPRNKYFVKK
ncbi:MAG: protein kinase [Endozoicomonadaceae bacterium]|nr:protein kinase [Endozoicomonadaceae bacterium]